MSNRPQNFRGPKTNHELSSCITTALHWVESVQQKKTELINGKDLSTDKLTLFFADLSNSMSKANDSLSDADFLIKLLPEHIQKMEQLLKDLKTARMEVAKAIRSIKSAERNVRQFPSEAISYLGHAKLDLYEALVCTDPEIEYPFNLPS